MSVTFIGVSSRDDIYDMSAFVSANGVDWFTHIADVDGEVWARDGVATQPAVAFIDDDGSVDIHVGSLGESGLADRLDELVAS